VGRTLLVTPTKLMEEMYDILLNTELAIIEALKPGKNICEAYEAGLQYFNEKKPEYDKYLAKNSFG